MYYRCRRKALSNGGNFHIAAVLRRRKTILRIDTNTDKTHPKAYHLNHSGHVCYATHAEQCALRFARPGDILYVMRFRKDGSFAMAKPCKVCIDWLNQAGVTTVFYTNEEGEWTSLPI